MSKKGCLAVIGLLIVSWAIVIGVVSLMIHVGKMLISFA